MQIPNISPPLLKKEWISFFIFSFFSTFTINFAEPSGSSAALNPPLKTIICDFSIALLKVSIEPFICNSFKLLNDLFRMLAPSFLNAWIVSYSQLVPGNTGTNTVGLPNPIFFIFFEPKREFKTEKSVYDRHVLPRKISYF